jgi:putative Holliday junction resolvase
MRSLGIDFGEKRIGLAISDPEGTLAVPLTTLIRQDDKSAIQQILDVARNEGAVRLVLGEPFNVDGTRGPAADRVRRFGERLAAKAERAGLSLEWVEETLTTVEATRRLREAGVDTRKDPARVDAVAAQILLQEALDREIRKDRGDT